MKIFHPTNIYIPLSYKLYDNNSFTGYLKYNNKLAALSRVYVKKHSSNVELADIYIIEELRGKKAPNGKKWSHIIMKSMLNAIKRRKFKRIWLWVTCDNIKAIKLYEKFNFKFKKFPVNLKNKIYKKHKWLRGYKIVYMIRSA